MDGSAFLNSTNIVLQSMVTSRNTVVSEMVNRIVLKGKAVKVCFYRCCRGVFVWLLIHGVEMPSLVEAN